MKDGFAVGDCLLRSSFVVIGDFRTHSRTSLKHTTTTPTFCEVALTTSGSSHWGGVTYSFRCVHLMQRWVQPLELPKVYIEDR